MRPLHRVQKKNPTSCGVCCGTCCGNAGNQVKRAEVLRDDVCVSTHSYPCGAG